MLNLATPLRFGGDEAASPDRLVHADNLAVMAELPDRSLDIIYMDPPFATGTVRRGRGGSEFGDRTDDPDAFVAWLAPRLAESRRLLDETGSLFVHLDYRATHYVKVALDRLFGRARLVNEIIWCYSVGGKSRRSFGRKHDSILWYARGADHAFYPDAVRVARKPSSHMRVVRGPDGEPVQEKTDRRTGRVYRYPVAAGKVPEDWWVDIETLNRADAERTGWPTQKPERLLERILAAASAPGARVADWFSGAGTTAVVAQRLGRRFLTVDVEREAVVLAAHRLARAGARLAAEGRPPPDVAVEMAIQTEESDRRMRPLSRAQRTNEPL
ncbi:MAG TPA: site-specific DNA-methyltransferase [Kofleriaceae bacterium]|nr:site-specific DNA-methyltransferase [Kofleriaceae bacterium]